MASFVIRRTLYAMVTLLILSLTIFTVVRLTGDPVTLMAEPGARAEDLDRIRVEWGLDRPLPVQYLSFLKNIATGELGKSFNYEMPVSTLYFQRLPNSLELALAATLISFAIASSARRRVAGLLERKIATTLRPESRRGRASGAFQVDTKVVVAHATETSAAATSRGAIPIGRFFMVIPFLRILATPPRGDSVRNARKRS